MTEQFRNLGRFVRTFEDYLLVVILAGMMLLAIAQILMRNFLGSGFSWIDPLVRISVLWIAMVGAMVGTRQGGHIAIDLLAHYVKPSLEVVLQRVIAGFSMVISGLMSWVSAAFVLEEIEYGETAFASVPAWPFEIIMPIGFGVIAIRFASHMVFGTKGRDV